MPISGRTLRRAATRCLLALALTLSGSASGRAGETPSARLSNGQLALTVLPPGTEQGRYRGPRFDGSGMVASVEYAGREIFGEWKRARVPGATDDVLGIVGEFGMTSPLGYAAANPGDPFFKIGVGKLVRPDARAYRFTEDYEVIPLPWTTARGEHWIAFSQELPPERGWGWRYTKRIELDPLGPSLTIRYELENTGSKVIDTDYYSHNFAVFDGRVPAAGLSLQLDFAPRDRAPFGDIAEVQGDVIRLKKVLPAGKALFREFVNLPSGQGKAVEIESRESGIGLRIEGDTVPEKVVFYACEKAVCFEPFVRIRLAPGETKSWSDRYSFYEL